MPYHVLQANVVMIQINAISLVPRPEEEKEAWFQPFMHALNRGGISNTSVYY